MWGKMDLSAKEKDYCVVPPEVGFAKENESESPLRATLTDIIDSDNPRTPNDFVFDPFAHVPHTTTIVRRLSFSSSAAGDDSLSDQHFFQTVYDNLLQFILSKQMEEEEEEKKRKGLISPISNVLVQHYDSDDDCISPPSMLCFTGIPHTCPPAPRKLKPAHQRNIIQLNLCKKLEF